MNKRCQFLSDYLERIDGAKPQQRIAKHVKMASDAFLFFRGSSQLFYADIASGKLTFPKALKQLPNTAIMGDCHVSNFGFFTEEGSHGDNVIFAPNDFDDACIGPAVWDIARFIVSLKLAANFGAKVTQGQLHTEAKYVYKSVVNQQQTTDAIHSFLAAYIQACQSSAQDPKVLSKAQELVDENHILYKPYLKAQKRSAGGIEFDIKSSLAKATHWQNEKLTFKHRPDKFIRIEDTLYQEIVENFSPYVDDTILDVVARQGAGTGSLNLARYYLLVGPTKVVDKSDLALCHIVEVKQQRPAAPLYHFNDLSAINRLNPAHLTVQCQRRMQVNPDLVLDEVEWQNQFWLVRSRHHAKVGISPEQIVLGKKATERQGFSQYASACGQALALSHCRNDRRSTRFEQSIWPAIEEYKQELIDTCLAYVEQVELDKKSLAGLVNS
ncbi:DUF2252 family protein [Thalassotalea marina]|uniref:DUF2252 domain-containing protein n=1 Tax=Thalassotalea marina TaxID=1673741 RepID=A0A919BK79_9GAMM|nr:DUF2252 family protein [Thalassotalea marina]GHF94291.1 hypothetical protein GCM10017161_23160 [Thalassotalea marina]